MTTKVKSTTAKPRKPVPKPETCEHKINEGVRCDACVKGAI